MEKSALQLARDIGLRLEREPRDGGSPILFRIFRDRALLGRYWPVSGVLECDGEERRMPDIAAALSALAPAGRREAA